MTMRRLALAILLAGVIAFAGAPVAAVEPPPGSKNFSAPSSVPNYFSNEAGPFQGTPTARPASPGATPSVAAAPSPRRVAAAAHRGRHGRGKAKLRLAHGKSGGKKKQLASARAAKGAKVAKTTRVAPRAGAKKAVAAKARPTSAKGKLAARGRG